jgi:hypothetical protein
MAILIYEGVIYMPVIQFFIEAETYKEIKRLADYKRINPSQYVKQRVKAMLKRNAKPSPDNLQ